MSIDTSPTSTALQLATVDPSTLRSVDQIRDDATPDPQLVDSVRRSGILQPPTVVWNDTEDAYFIVFGHRRVGAAILAGLTEITVIVRDTDTLPGPIALGDQISENERRKGLSSAEVARGWADMEQMFGMSPEEIAESLAEKPERVRAGIRAARSASTVKLLAERPTIDLERAAILTEFDDYPDIQKALAGAAERSTGDFDWQLKNAQLNVERSVRRAELNNAIEASGVALAPLERDTWLEEPAKKLAALLSADGEQIEVDGHASCPGHAAYVTGYQPEQMEIVYCCLDPNAHGHQVASGFRGVPTEEEKRAEEEREARRALLEANRAARRQWITNLLPGKINQLAGVYEYMAAALLDNSSYYYQDTREPELTLSLLGVEANGDSSAQLDGLVAGKKAAPFRLMLAVSFAVHENHCKEGTSYELAVRHFEQLQKWGYTLTEIDQTALDSWRQILSDEEYDGDIEGEEA